MLIKIATAIAIHPVTCQPLRCCLIRVRMRRSRSLRVADGLATNHKLNGEKGCCHCIQVTQAIAGNPNKNISSHAGKTGSPTAKPAIPRVNNQGTAMIRTICPTTKGLLFRGRSPLKALRFCDAIKSS